MFSSWSKFFCLSHFNAGSIILIDFIRDFWLRKGNFFEDNLKFLQKINYRKHWTKILDKSNIFTFSGTQSYFCLKRWFPKDAAIIQLNGIAWLGQTIFWMILIYIFPIAGKFSIHKQFKTFNFVRFKDNTSIFGTKKYLQILIMTFSWEIFGSFLNLATQWTAIAMSGLIEPFRLFNVPTIAL